MKRYHVRKSATITKQTFTKGFNFNMSKQHSTEKICFVNKETKGTQPNKKQFQQQIFVEMT